MPLSPTLVSWLVDMGHDAVHVGSLGLHKATDSGIVAHAKSESRIIVTADLDYPRLLATASSHEPSLILFRSGDLTEAAVRRRLTDAITALGEEGIVGSIVVIDRDRIRRRRLPLGR
jgi:predicted nuclease of predicted toxin-antitoxin system